MPLKELSDLFFKAIYQLIGWEYDPATLNQHSLAAKTVVNQFIYNPLTKEQKQQIDRRSRTHRMRIPPPLDSMIDVSFVAEQVNLVLNQIAEGKTLDELNAIYSTGEPVSLEEFNSMVSKLMTTKR